MSVTKLDIDTPPLCPACGKQVFRPGRMAALFEHNEKHDGSFTVCMHCSRVWRLLVDGERVTLAEIGDEESDIVWPTLSIAANVFTAKRVVAESMGMSLEEYLDMIER